MTIKLSDDMKDQSSHTEPNLTMTILLLPGHHHHNHKPPEVAGSVAPPVTPPLHPMASVPFQWEEAPGKPRRPNDETTLFSPITKPKNARRFLDLDPPPARFVLEKKKSNSLPITTNLQLSCGGGYGSGGLDKEEVGVCGCCRQKEKPQIVVGDGKGGFDFSINGNREEDESYQIKVEISRLRRKGNMFNLFRSRFFESVRGSLKQMAWRRRSKPQ